MKSCYDNLLPNFWKQIKYQIVWGPVSTRCKIVGRKRILFYLKQKLFTPYDLRVSTLPVDFVTSVKFDRINKNTSAFTIVLYSNRILNLKRVKLAYNYFMPSKLAMRRIAYRS